MTAERRVDRQIVIAAAAVAGVPVRRIAGAFGLSTSRVYEILDGIRDEVDRGRKTGRRRNSLPPAPKGSTWN